MHFPNNRISGKPKVAFRKPQLTFRKSKKNFKIVMNFWKRRVNFSKKYSTFSKMKLMSRNRKLFPQGMDLPKIEKINLRKCTITHPKANQFSKKGKTISMNSMNFELLQVTLIKANEQYPPTHPTNNDFPKMTMAFHKKGIQILREYPPFQPV